MDEIHYRPSADEMLFENSFGIRHGLDPVPDSVGVHHDHAAPGMLGDAGVRADHDVGHARLAQPALVQLINRSAHGLAAVLATVSVRVVFGHRVTDALALGVAHRCGLGPLLREGAGPVIRVFGRANEYMSHDCSVQALFGLARGLIPTPGSSPIRRSGVQPCMAVQCLGLE